MELVLKNTKLVFKYQIVDTVAFNISYDALVNYNLQGDVNLIYAGDIHIGDSVEINFEDENDGNGSILLYTKGNGSYGDGKGLGTMRVTVGNSRTTAYPITCTADCSNIKIFVNNKASDFGSSSYYTNGFKGTVTIRRAVQNG